MVYNDSPHHDFPPEPGERIRVGRGGFPIRDEQDQAGDLILRAGGVAQSQGYGFHVTTLWSGQLSVGRWMAPAEVIREFEHWHPQFLADPSLVADPAQPVSPAAAAVAESRLELQGPVTDSKTERPWIHLGTEEEEAAVEREGHWVADFHYADSDRVVRRQTTGDEPVTEGVAEALFRVTALADELVEATVYLDQGDGTGLEYWGQMDFTAQPAEV